MSTPRFHPPMSLRLLLDDLGRVFRRLLSGKGVPQATFSIDHILAQGRLTEARGRFRLGLADPDKKAKYSHRPTWQLVCEEVLDTDFDPPVYDAIYAELLRRGYDDRAIDDLRRLAWETAGWMNYDLMLWDWVDLDESDMRAALDLQRERGLIGAIEHGQRLDRIREVSERPIPE